jgi:transcriptional regulator with XRE-family HTH domain
MNKIARARKRLNLSQQKLAELSGLSHKMIQALEYGRTKVEHLQYYRAIKLAKALKMPNVRSMIE